MLAVEKTVKTVTRSVGIAMAHPLGDKDAFWQTLRAAWAESTSLANWAVLEMVKADVTRTPGMEKLPKLTVPYLYGIWGREYDGRKWWTGAAASANCIFQAVSRKYLQERGAVLWQRRRALPTFRYPYPFRVHQRDWRLSEQDGRLVVAFPLPGGRVEVVLRGGAEYGRQIGELRSLLRGQARQGELLVTEHAKTKQVIFRFGLKRLVTPIAEAEHILLVRTDPNALWVAEISGQAQPWILNADHVRRWVDGHRVFRQRLSEDMKREKNATRQQRQHMQQALDVRCRKQQDRLDSFTHQASAQLAEYARRRRVAEVIYDDSHQGYFASFPWHDLRTKLAYKLAQNGITFTHVGASEGE